MIKNQKTFVNQPPIDYVFYSFELQMAGVILLTAMMAGGISLWIKRRRASAEFDETQKDEAQNF